MKIHIMAELRMSAVGSDVGSIGRILDSTGVFHPREIAVAIELLEDNLAKKEMSEYRFIFAAHGGEVVGYVCYGPITMTESGYDIYWIAVREDMQRCGVAALLMEEAERAITEARGKYIYIETSTRDIYAPAREFYTKRGYTRVATVPHYYADNDDKAVFMKAMS